MALIYGISLVILAILIAIAPEGEEGPEGFRQKQPRE